MNNPTAPLRGIRYQLDRLRHRTAGLTRSLRGRRDAREVSMKRTDENATGAASAAQSADDAEDRRAGAPAEQGGQG